MLSYQIYNFKRLLYMHLQCMSKLNHKHIGDISTTNQVHVGVTNVFVLCAARERKAANNLNKGG
jgi:hypothetical protein